MALCELLVRLAAVEGRILLLEGPANIDVNIYKLFELLCSNKQVFDDLMSIFYLVIC